MTSYQFHGTAIDGPWRGQYLENHSPQLTVSFLPPPLSYLSPWRPPEVVTVRQGRYRWSYSLSQWTYIGEM